MRALRARVCGASLTAQGNVGLAYTYNEPLVGWEFVRDCAAEIRARGMLNVLVTNGCFCLEPLEGLLPLIDAAKEENTQRTTDPVDQMLGR